MDTRLVLNKQRALRKPSLLKDYLLDDMSSCSSNGFKSFPRRSSSSTAAASHCCSTIRFLHDIDAKSKQQKKKLMNLNEDKRSRNKGIISKFKSAITSLSRFSLTKMERKKSLQLLPRSLSKKLMRKFSKNSKWSSAHREIEEWKVFDEYLDEYNSSSVAAAISGRGLQLESEFTVLSEEYGCSSDENSSSAVVKCECDQPTEKNDAVEESEDSVAEDGVVSKDQSTTCSEGGDSTTTNSSTKKQQWSSEEKEQFSPVSVLDRPFDEEDEVSSSTQRRLARIEGTRKNLMKKIEEFESFTSPEPVSLAQRFTEQDLSEIESSSPLIGHEHKALELLQQVKDSVSSYGLRANNTDKLMTDFFTERLKEESLVKNYYSLEEELLDEAEDWIKGTKRYDAFLGIGVQKNNEAYIHEIEKDGKWNNKRKAFDHQREENQEIARVLEDSIFCDVFDELLLHISP